MIRGQLGPSSALPQPSGVSQGGGALLPLGWLVEGAAQDRRRRRLTPPRSAALRDLWQR